MVPGCKRKLALSDFPCSKCSVATCQTHRLPEDHGCVFDFKKEGRSLLEKQNPVVVGVKLQRV